ncbi:PAP2-domain-containing protein [Ceraceosorus guamensis]|uniref:PAP2-domain-containing protein n=1 Tax=Ceraceosorus guamensis TaxID=1522189 RepID=A0A316W1F9_9BASI|nr:PAP2-domain-containing protein [Ceraceosorus guamensis]PWN43519.1 PAP2-domain-containing protein [Ceraceosorus guamensis]
MQCGRGEQYAQSPGALHALCCFANSPPWLTWEFRCLACPQTIVRRPNLDRYFVYTSLLGTHSFFLIFLPMAFWLGSPMLARGLVNVLAFGVYFSSAIKDLFCIPRPFSPPCTRLVIGTTHLEYGFLSTHSTNAMGVAFYLYLWLGALRSHAQSPVLDSWFWEILLGYYAISVVYGRLYAGMHSLMDCVAGSLLGAGISWVQWHFMDAIERFYILEGWTVPLVSIPATLLMVSIHPQPLDDCPCFEDAIAFIAVVLGVVLARWANCKWDLLDRNDHPLDSHWPDGPGVAEKAKQMWYGAIGISEPQPWLASLQTKGDASVLLTWALWGLKSLTALVLGGWIRLRATVTRGSGADSTLKRPPFCNGQALL